MRVSHIQALPDHTIPPFSLRPLDRPIDKDWVCISYKSQGIAHTTSAGSEIQAMIDLINAIDSIVRWMQVPDPQGW